MNVTCKSDSLLRRKLHRARLNLVLRCLLLDCSILLFSSGFDTSAGCIHARGHTANAQLIVRSELARHIWAISARLRPTESPANHVGLIPRMLLLLFAFEQE